MREVDLAIIGAGVAGLTAARVAAEQGASVLVIERMGAGGQVMNVERVDGMPGFDDGISGFELGPELQERAEVAGAEFMLDTVTAIRQEGRRHLVECENDTISARAVVIASGSRRKKLGVPGEAELEGRGVSHCASCDGPLFRGDSVCVVGGGDSAFSEALVLAHHAAKVSIVFSEPVAHARPKLFTEAAALPNVELVSAATVIGIEGGAGVTHVKLRRASLESELAVQGVFVYAGLEAETGFLGDAIERAEDGRIRTDDGMSTAVPGIFAAGDIRSGVDYQLADVARDGEAAARSACAYIQFEGDIVVHEKLV